MKKRIKAGLCASILLINSTATLPFSAYAEEIPLEEQENVLPPESQEKETGAEEKVPVEVEENEQTSESEVELNEETNIQINTITTTVNEYQFADNGDGTATITKYLGDSQDVIIPEILDGLQVTEIGGGTFANKQLNSVTLPQGLKIIGEAAFYRNNLTEVRLPDTLEYVGVMGFGENFIETVNIPVSLDEIDNLAFYDNELTEIIIPDSIDKIGMKAFGFNNIKNFTINGDVKDLGSNGQGWILENELSGPAFRGTGSTKINKANLIIKGNVETIHGFAFQNDVLSSVLIEGDVGSIGQFAFSSQGGKCLENVEIQGSVGEIGAFAFRNVSHADSIKILGDVKEIRQYAFKDTIVDSILIDGSVYTIGESSFDGSEGNILTINGDVNTIKGYAFLNNTVLNVTINGNVTMIEQDAFQSANNEILLINGFVDTADFYSFLMVDVKKELQVRDGIKNIGDNAFTDAKAPVLDIFKNVENIGFSAFSRAETESEVILPDSLVAMGEEAFLESKIGRLSIGKSLDKISKNAFLRSTVPVVTIPGNIITIQATAFINSNLGELELENGIKNLDTAAFAGNKITKIKLPETLEKIGEGTFNNNQLACVTIPQAVTEIGPQAFDNNQDNSEDFVIWGDKGSVAETYAINNAFTFKENVIFVNDCNPSNWAIEVKYQDEQGNVIDSKTINKPAKGNHTENAKVIPGYTLKGNNTVSVEVTNDKPSHIITFTYKKDEKPNPPETLLGTVTVNYLDAAGNVLDSKILKDLPLGTHTEQAKNIIGYEITGPSQQSVEITKELTQFTITFTYKKTNQEPSNPVPSLPETTPPVTQEPSLPETPSEEVENHKGKRVIRDEGNGTFTTVPHFLDNNLKLKITTKYNYGLLITDRVAVPFKDMDGLFSYQEVEDLYNYLITTGTTSSTYSPYASISRGQFSAMIARALELRPTSTNYKFTDVTWYQKDVQALYEAGIVTGFPDGTFGETKPLSRQQAAAMIVRMLSYMDVDTKGYENILLADMDSISDYAKEPVKYLASHDVLINGEETNFNPFNNLTRAQMAKILMRALRLSDWY
ncbi:leucine-rich repeat protein [Lysinibacillus sp. NPDC093712]|uniref:leucine-rich repeat protein n=1 Tax=Lysinibacillus sp. NPDC093712 TaxID=3390579 RepID=UPI003D0451C6